MNLVAIKRVTGLLLIFTGLQAGLFAQDKNAAIGAFNESVNLMKTDPVSAIGSFENCIKICEQVGDSANDIKSKAVKVLPDLYYEKASDLLLVDKKINESLAASKKAMDVAKKYNDTAVVENVKKIMIQAYSAMGASLAATEPDKAIILYDSALAINPHHQASLYNKALIYRKTNNAEKFSQTLDLYIDELKPVEEESKIAQANKIALDFYRGAAGKSNQANKLGEALAYLNTSLKYGNDKTVFYYFADIYNKQKKYADAAINAQKGLDLETGDAEAKAKYYFQLGLAQKGKGDTAAACETFTNALFGQFAAPAKAERTNLKCK
jgi:tetratricopeptide (TPR) repeat protein